MSIWQPHSRLLPKSRWICNRCIAELSHGSVTKRQRRWITQNHIRKIMTADQEWQQRRQEIENGDKKSMLDLLEERGFVNQIVGTRDELNNLLNARRVGVYAGVDPTAPSLHVGHMVPFMAVGWMYIHGYSTTYLMGGFTAGIGDPIGRLTGRKAQSTKERTANSAAMHKQLTKLSASIHQYADRKGYKREWAWRRGVKNNYVWWQNVTVNDFMRVMGAGTRIGPMLGRDTVKNRLESGEGMSFAEFMYPLAQAWDWWELYQQGVQIQIGGSDQFGNILAGAEAVKYMINNDPMHKQVKEQTRLATPSPGSDDPMGFTVPLLTTSSGEKFGKSAGNAVWLDPSMTSSFDLYQFFLRSADTDVERYLKLFTFLPLSEIAEIMAKQNEDQSQRIAQHKLAYEFVELVHGVQAAKEAESQHKAMFNKNTSPSGIYSQLQSSNPEPTASSSSSNPRPDDLHPSINRHAAPLDMHTGGPVSIKLPSSLVIQQSLPRILWSAGLVASRSEGQRLINNRGVYVGGRNNKDGPKPLGDVLDYAQIEDPKWSTVSPFIVDDNLLILRTGKWRVKVIEIVPDDEFERLGLTCPGWKEGEDPVQAGDGPSLTDLDLHGEEKLRMEKRLRDEEREKKRLKAESKQRRHEAWRLKNQEQD